MLLFAIFELQQKAFTQKTNGGQLLNPAGIPYIGLFARDVFGELPIAQRDLKTKAAKFPPKGSANNCRCFPLPHGYCCALSDADQINSIDAKSLNVFFACPTATK